MELSEALPTLLQSSRVIPTKPPSEEALTQVNTIPGSGLVTHSPKCHELAEQKDIFVDVSYICTADFAGIGMMGVLLFSHSLHQVRPSLQTNHAFMLSLLQTC